MNDLIRRENGRVARVFFDLTPWLSDPLTLRTAKDLHRTLPGISKEESKQAIVVSAEAPPDGMSGITVLDWPLPDRDVMAAVLDSFAEWAPESARKSIQNGIREPLIDSMLGLTADDAANALSRSLVADGTFDRFMQQGSPLSGNDLLDMTAEHFTAFNLKHLLCGAIAADDNALTVGADDGKTGTIEKMTKIIRLDSVHSYYYRNIFAFTSVHVSKDGTSIRTN